MNRLTFVSRHFVLLAVALPLAAQYSGPAILSRGEAPVGISLPQIRFQPYVSIQAQYATGLTNAALDENGELARTGSFGARLGWGITGAHAWKRTRLGLSYSGSASHYRTRSGYDSIDQNVMIGVTRQLTRHAAFSFNQTAGIYTRDFGLKGLPQSVPFDPATMFIPTTDYFDNRTYYLGSQANLTLQKSARTSFNFGAGNFYTGRRSKALSDSIVQTATGDIQRRLTKRITTGASYQFMRFRFNSTNDTVVHTAGPTFGMRLSPSVEVSSLFGITRVESKFVHEGVVDPVIAALLGIKSTTQIIHRIEYLKAPTFMIRLSRAFRTGYVYAAGGHSVTPGNGLFLTSYAYTAMTGYSYTGLRRWSVNAQAAYFRGEAVGTIAGQYSSVTETLGIARKFRGVSFTLNGSARRYDSGTYASYRRTVFGATAGVSWSPGEVPLRLW